MRGKLARVERVAKWGEVRVVRRFLFLPRWLLTSLRSDCEQMRWLEWASIVQRVRYVDKEGTYAEWQNVAWGEDEATP